jgi:hypothetical protein
VMRDAPDSGTERPSLLQFYHPNHAAARPGEAPAVWPRCGPGAADLHGFS